MAKMKKRGFNLRTAYRQMNRSHFSNKLPNRALIEWAGLDREGCIGLCTQSAGAPPLIQISTRLLHPLLRNVAKLTLLHECAHLAADLKHPSRESHGRFFQAEMFRLAKRGALEKLW